MTEDAHSSAALESRHPGWTVWTSRPTAKGTRASARPRNDGIWARRLRPTLTSNSKLNWLSKTRQTPTRARIVRDLKGARFPRSFPTSPAARRPPHRKPTDKAELSGTTRHGF